MLHIVQVVLSGVPEIPKIFFDEAKAESAYVECAKEYWTPSYSAYCEKNGVSMDCLASAQAFVDTFDLAEKSKIYYWIVKPEDMGLDKMNLLADLTDKVTNMDVLLSDDQYVGNTVGYIGLLPPILQQEKPEETAEMYIAPELKAYVESIKNTCGSRNEYHLFTRQDWRQDVYSNLTTFDYWEWVAAKISESTPAKLESLKKP
ncbi:MAG TPA: hypothetical protein VMC44_00640 [Geobacteraceae bacterium]|nr:hypothetical protein [Geobacteraceae bacterium]